MFQSHYIAASGGDLFPLVIIVVAILAQIIKASKGPKPTTTQPDLPGSGSGDYTAPEDELKKFLESLSGGTTKPAVERPPPLPPAVKVNPPPLRAQQQTARPALAAASRKAAEDEQKPYEITVPDTAVLETQRPSSAQSEASPESAFRKSSHTERAYREVHQLRSIIITELADDNSLRKAILLREILGPCLAMRRAGTGIPSL